MLSRVERYVSAGPHEWTRLYIGTRSPSTAQDPGPPNQKVIGRSTDSALFSEDSKDMNQGGEPQPERNLVPIDHLDAVIFDMDGVVTDTARVHSRCWKKVFDGIPFSPDRSARVTSFYRSPPTTTLSSSTENPAMTERPAFASRGIDLLRGEPTDPPGHDSICAIANLKDLEFAELVESEGVDPFPTTVAFIHSLRCRNVLTALISSSRHAKMLLKAASVTDLFDSVVDGIDADELGLPGKPDPAIFLTPAGQLGVLPSRAAIVEDALAGVEAGRRGGFGLVLGIGRASHAEALLEHGADLVVTDLSELLLPDSDEPR